MQYGCQSDGNGQCPTTTEPLTALPECQTEVFEQDTQFYKLRVHSPAIEWAGSCQEGSCQVCREGVEISCGDRPRRYCVNGEWTYQQWHGPAKKAEVFLIAACTLLGCCFLALLGVIAAIMMLK